MLGIAISCLSILVNPTPANLAPLALTSAIPQVIGQSKATDGVQDMRLITLANGQIQEMGVLCDLLTEAKIPFVCQGSIGYGLAVGVDDFDRACTTLNADSKGSRILFKRGLPRDIFRNLPENAFAVGKRILQVPSIYGARTIATVNRSNSANRPKNPFYEAKSVELAGLTETFIGLQKLTDKELLSAFLVSYYGNRVCREEWAEFRSMVRFGFNELTDDSLVHELDRLTQLNYVVSALFETPPGSCWPFDSIGMDGSLTIILDHVNDSPEELPDPIERLKSMIAKSKRRTKIEVVVRA